MKLFLTVAMLVALAVGGPATALEVGDQIGPLTANPGGAICDTAEQAERAIDVYDGGQGNIPSGCGILRGHPRILLEAIRMHESSYATYIILKITFLPPATLGVQYGWQTHSKAPGAGDSV